MIAMQAVGNSDLSLADAAEYLPRRNGKKVHVLTIKRWIRKGSNGVRLNGWRYGNSWYTNEAAINQFKLDCTAASGVTTFERTPTESVREAEDARERLRRKGFYGSQQKVEAA